MSGRSAAHSSRCGHSTARLLYRVDVESRLAGGQCDRKGLPTSLKRMMSWPRDLGRPGGNVTGFSDVLLDLSGKYVEMARALGEPQAAVIHYLWYKGWADGQQRFQ